MKTDSTSCGLSITQTTCCHILFWLACKWAAVASTNHKAAFRSFVLLNAHSICKSPTVASTNHKAAFRKFCPIKCTLHIQMICCCFHQSYGCFSTFCPIKCTLHIYFNVCSNIGALKAQLYTRNANNCPIKCVLLQRCIF